MYVSSPKKVLQVKQADVDVLLLRNIDRINQASEQLGISITKPSALSEVNITKSEVLNKIFYANIQIENILYQKTSPREVYEDMVQANKNIIAILSKPQSLEKSFVIKNDKTPADVYDILLQCVDQLEIYAKNIGHNITTVKLSDKEIGQEIYPSNVLNLAKLLLTETDYLRSLKINIKDNNVLDLHESYKTPTDVYRQASTLLKNLKELNNTTQKSNNLDKKDGYN